jgi:MGT family glycosyltransferase
MARIMVAVLPFAGHVAPVRSVVAELIQRGHEVRVYTGAAYANDFRAVGADIVGWTAAPDFDENDLEATFPALRGRKGPRQMLANLEHLFIRTAAGQAKDLTDAWIAWPWDLLLSETTSIGAPLAAEITGAPWASLSIIPLTLSSRSLPPAGLGLVPGAGPLGRLRDGTLRRVTAVLTSSLNRALNETRAEAGLKPSARPFNDVPFSSTLIMATGTPLLDLNRPDPPPHLHYVGSVTRMATEPLPRWWSDVADATVPVVHVTQGTLNLDPGDLTRPALSALADEDILVVASTGRSGVDTLPFPVPPNVRVAGFIPHGASLPHTSAMITNGGWGGVLNALSVGVPLVVAGGDIDKPEVAARVAWAGAGVNLHTGTPTAAAIRRAYRALIENDGYASRAGQVARQLAAHGGATEAADLLEGLL